uniref:Endoglucanase n=1 Tax=Streptomyces sp. NRRL 30748 TaxID=367779 RepID=Q1WEL8_9ACTN|nr:beta-1,4-endo glucanase [Streptomyces sp. NRRL 30748]
MPGTVGSWTGTEGRSAGTCGRSAGSCGRSAGTVGSCGRSVGSCGRSAGTVGRSAGSCGRSAGSCGRSAGTCGRSAGSCGRSAGTVGSCGRSVGSCGRSAGTVGRSAGSCGRSAGSCGRSAGSTGRAGMLATSVRSVGTAGSRLSAPSLALPTVVWAFAATPVARPWANGTVVPATSCANGTAVDGTLTTTGTRRSTVSWAAGTTLEAVPSAKPSALPVTTSTYGVVRATASSASAPVSPTVRSATGTTLTTRRCTAGGSTSEATPSTTGLVVPTAPCTLPVSSSGRMPAPEREASRSLAEPGAEGSFGVITTGDHGYAKAVLDSPLHRDVGALFPRGGGMSWASTAGLGALDLATVPNKLTPKQRAEVRAMVTKAADRYAADSAKSAYGVPYAPKDGKYEWGSNSQVLNNMIVLATAHDLTDKPRYLDAVLRGMDYLLGGNPLNQSYVTGHGERDSHNQHHRFWAHQRDHRLPHPAPGSLAGGPNSGLQDPVAKKKLKGCAPAMCYTDSLMAFSTNEITINWNAPLAWIASYVDGLGGGAAEQSVR